MADGMRLGYILMHAELEEVICSGARQGRQHAYALFDDRVPPGVPFDRDEALAGAVRRFFTSHGPATVRDFTWWSYLTVADARRGLALRGDDLESIEVTGRTYWGWPAMPPPRSGRPRPEPTSCRSTTSTSSPTARAATSSTWMDWPASCRAAR